MLDFSSFAYFVLLISHIYSACSKGFSFLIHMRLMIERMILCGGIWGGWVARLESLWFETPRFEEEGLETYLAQFDMAFLKSQKQKRL